jgi:membrane protease YdiL (CAAX protease family)
VIPDGPKDAVTNARQSVTNDRREWGALEVYACAARRESIGWTAMSTLAGGLLGLAVVSLWWTGAVGRVACVVLAVAALAAGGMAGAVAGSGLVVAGLWFAVVAWWSRDGNAPGWRRVLAAAVVLGGAAGLMAHVWPGFANPRVIDGVRFTPDAVPFSLFVNFDKTLIALALLGLAHPRASSGVEWRAIGVAVLRAAPVLLGAVLIGSYALGYVRWAPKLPAEAPLWLAVNLLFTCTAEEALFRGFIQGGLRRAWSGVRGGPWLALAVAAVLFGLAHAAGGWRYVLLATVAGVGYGWVYERTQRVEASILLHWALNATHLFLFTYPALAR